MMRPGCTALAPTYFSLPIGSTDDWDQASLYDTLVQYFFVTPSPATRADEQVNFSLEAATTKSSLLSFERGTTAGFDLISLGESTEHDWSSVELVRELRRLSGLTWNKAAELVGVSPKTLHNWVAGQTVAETNLRRLGDVLAVLRYIDRGYGEANRGLLINTSAEGRTLFALLADGQYDVVKETAGRGVGRPMSSTPLPPETIHTWGADHFGIALSSAKADMEDEILPIKVPGKRSAMARRKG